MYYHNSYLYHYGIKGMKWGVRKEYEKKGRRRSKKNEQTTDEPKKKGLTDKQKKAIKIGAAAVATGLAIYGGHKLHQAYVGAGQQIDPITGFRFLKNESDASDLHKINPGRVRFLSRETKNVELIDGSSTNCMLCTTAYELRKRGYDVHAGLEKSGTGYLPDDLFPNIFQDYKGTKKIFQSFDTSLDKNGNMVMDAVNRRKTFEKLEDHIRNEGSGARGNIMVWWDKSVGGGGHSMIWENVDGNVVFKDGQTGEVYKNFFDTIMTHSSTTKPVEILRTDNLTINTTTAKNFLNTDTIVKTYIDHGAEVALNAATDPLISTTVMGGAYATSMAVSTTSNKIQQNRAIKNYKSENPNTSLSNKEIAKMLGY